MNKTKLVPFDIEKAEHGAKVVTRDGHSVKIGLYDIKYKNFPIVGVVQEGVHETPYCFTKNGKFNEDEDHPYDLFIEKEVKTRYMTFEELAMWLTEKPHRQYKTTYTGSTIKTSFEYSEECSNDEAEGILIREDGGEWHEPLVEIEEQKEDKNEEV